MLNIFSRSTNVQHWYLLSGPNPQRQALLKILTRSPFHLVSFLIFFPLHLSGVNLPCSIDIFVFLIRCSMFDVRRFNSEFVFVAPYAFQSSLPFQPIFGYTWLMGYILGWLLVVFLSCQPMPTHLSLIGWTMLDHIKSSWVEPNQIQPSRAKLLVRLVDTCILHPPLLLHVWSYQSWPLLWW